MVSEPYYESLIAFRNQLDSRSIRLTTELRETDRLLMAVRNEIARCKNEREGRK